MLGSLVVLCMATASQLAVILWQARAETFLKTQNWRVFPIPGHQTVLEKGRKIFVVAVVIFVDLSYVCPLTWTESCRVQIWDAGFLWQMYQCGDQGIKVKVARSSKAWTDHEQSSTWQQEVVYHILITYRVTGSKFKVTVCVTLCLQELMAVEASYLVPHCTLNLQCHLEVSRSEVKVTSVTEYWHKLHH